MYTKWHPTQAEAEKEAQDAELEHYKLTSTRVTLDEPHFPRKWWRAVPTRAEKCWTMSN